MACISLHFLPGADRKRSHDIPTVKRRSFGPNLAAPLKVGAEIPFNRPFYVFELPHSLAEIDADLEVVTGIIVRMVGGLSA